VIKKYQIVPKYSHLDSTSFHLHGEYNNRPNREPEQEVITEHPITITHGYSRDHRPDLKQCILDLIVSGDGEIPLFLRVGSGNESDKAMFGKILVEYGKQIDFESTMVADSAFYTANNLKMMENIKWISRVPLSIKAAKNLVREQEEKELIVSTNQGYSYWEKRISYGGVEQRWLLVESAERKKSDRHKILKKIETERREITKKLANISRQEFDLEATATSQIIALESKLKYHLLVDKQIVTSVRTGKESYTISALIAENTELINHENNQAGRFILATNSLESSPLSCDDILTEYKNQQGCERGFNFLKDPWFFADSLFVKNPERVETMMMLMGLALLVYKLGQRQIRIKLQAQSAAIKNQLNKLTAQPTLIWIFQCFQGIHLLNLDGRDRIINLTHERQHILQFLPLTCQAYYR
jgi:transposase